MKILRTIALSVFFLNVQSGAAWADELESQRSVEERVYEAFRFADLNDFEAALQSWISIKKTLERSLDVPTESFQVIEFEIGSCFLNLGRFAEARDAYKRCFLLTASDEERERILSAISKLE